MNNLIDLLQSFLFALRTEQLPQLGIWTYFLLAVLVAVEGPIATLLGAVAASAGLMKPGWVFLAAAVGNMTADSLWYTLGYLGKIDWILRIGKRVRIKREILERLEIEMSKHAARILFAAKLTLTLMIPALIAAGLVKAPWRKWFPAIFGGEMIWTGSLILIGYYATEAIKKVELGVEYVAFVGSLMLVGLLIFVWRKAIKKRYGIKDEPKKQK